MTVPLPGIDPAHVQAVHKDIFFRQRHPQRLRQRDAGCAVDHRWDAVGRGNGPGQRVDLDDSPPVLLTHMRYHGLNETEMPHLQNIGMFENRLRCKGIDIAAATLAGIVHQYIHAAPAFGYFINEAPHSLCVDYIDGACNHASGLASKLATSCSYGFQRSRTDCNASAFGGKGTCDGQADAPGSTRDDDAFVAQIDVHLNTCLCVGRYAGRLWTAETALGLPRRPMKKFLSRRKVNEFMINVYILVRELG